MNLSIAQLPRSSGTWSPSIFVWQARVICLLESRVPRLYRCRCCCEWLDSCIQSVLVLSCRVNATQLLDEVRRDLAYMDCLEKAIHIYEHVGRTCVSNGTDHVFVDPVSPPWIGKLFWERKCFGCICLRLPVHCFIELFAAVRTLKPYLSNGVLNSYVTNHVQLPGNMPNPRASGSGNLGVPASGPGAVHGAAANAGPDRVEPTPVPPPTLGSNPEQATPPVKRKRSDLEDDRFSAGANTPATTMSKMSTTAIPYFVMYEEDGTAKLLETESGSPGCGPALHAAAE